MPNDALDRGAILSLLAVLMGLLGLSNLWKPFAQHFDPAHAGFVFFGTRTHGLANAVLGPLFGVVLIAYSFGVWTLRRWVVPIAIAYAAYVIVNLILFASHPPPGAGGPGFAIVYAAIAIGVSSGGALYLYRHRSLLR